MRTGKTVSCSVHLLHLDSSLEPNYIIIGGNTKTIFLTCFLALGAKNSKD